MVWADAQQMVANFSWHLAALRPSWDNLHPTPWRMAPFATDTDVSPFSPPWDPKKTVGYRSHLQDTFNVTVTAMTLREIKSFLHLLFGERVSIPLPATPHWTPGLYPDKEMAGNVCAPRRPLLQFGLEIHSHCSALGGPSPAESSPKQENRFPSVLKNVAPAWSSPEMVTKKANAPPANRARFIASRARGVLYSLCKHNQGSDSEPC